MCQPVNYTLHTTQTLRNILMSKKVKVSDIRQGVTLYYVRAFPHKGANQSYIQAYRVSTRPRKSEHSNGLFSEGLVFFEGDYGQGSFTRKFSLKDAGIIPNRYNFHNSFTSLKRAKRYAARLDQQCLNAAELQKLERIKENHRIWCEWD